jgi:hypothetical protein
VEESKEGGSLKSNPARIEQQDHRITLGTGKSLRALCLHSFVRGRLDLNTFYLGEEFLELRALHATAYREI